MLFIRELAFKNEFIFHLLSTLSQDSELNKVGTIEGDVFWIFIDCIVFLQRQQYPFLPEVELQIKAELWRQSDVNRRDITQSFYQDSLAQHQSVSRCILANVPCQYNFVQMTMLTFQSSFLSSRSRFRPYSTVDELLWVPLLWTLQPSLARREWGIQALIQTRMFSLLR